MVHGLETIKAMNDKAAKDHRMPNAIRWRKSSEELPDKHRWCALIDTNQMGLTGRWDGKQWTDDDDEISPGWIVLWCYMQEIYDTSGRKTELWDEQNDDVQP